MKKEPQPYTFDKILQEAKSRVDNFPVVKNTRLKAKLEHGLGDLSTQDEMDMYLTTYGEIHQSKLLLALSKVPRRILSENTISVIDYGCGQGIASIVLCDVLHSNDGSTYLISEFYPIEPSEACLKRAIDFIHKSYPTANITYFNYPCEDIWRMDIKPKSKVVIHLFSNVLDIPDFPRERVAKKIKMMRGYINMVLCVSPFYQENGRGKHMDEFVKMLHPFSLLYSLDKHSNDWDKPFSCQIRILTNNGYPY